MIRRVIRVAVYPLIFGASIYPVMTVLSQPLLVPLGLILVATPCVSVWLTLLSALGISACQSGLHLGAIAPLFRCSGRSSLASKAGV